MQSHESNQTSVQPEIGRSPHHVLGSHRRRQRQALGSESRVGRLLRRVSGRIRSDDGAATAEYAVATMAAVGFAGLLIIILRGDEVRAMLTDLVRNALTVG